MRPSHFHPRWAVLRLLAKAIERAIAAMEVGPEAVVLDFGCAERPYERLFAGKFLRYLAADLPGNERADVVVTLAGRVPIADGSVDCVASTQVLEHVEDPSAYLAEARRVLRPDGLLLISTHGFWVYHPDPVDFWRWTRAGLERELRAAGFEPVRTESVLNFAATALQLWQDATASRIPGALRPLYVYFLQRLVALLSALRAREVSDNAAIYVIVARKADALSRTA
jgi:SAM-dependent methyltransferase